jgi:DegV family protein with EDD domain
MPDVVIMTDSNAGMTQEEGKKCGVEILPMSFIINGKICYEERDISHEAFFRKLEENAQVSTSQPAPGEVMELWEKLLKRHDEVVYIPMSGGLSKSFETARMLAGDYNGRVQVVDSKRISVPQKLMVSDGLALAKEGKTAAQIRMILEESALDCAIYIAVDTLKYLKRGGRITGAAAAIGTMLNIKPVLLMKGERLDAYEKARGTKAARRVMLEAIRKELEGPFKEYADKNEVCLQMAHTCMKEELIAEWETKIREEFPDLKLETAPLPLCIACHIGPDGFGIGITRRIRMEN